MKTNLVYIPEAETFGKFLGDFDYVVYPDTYNWYADEQVVFANIYRLIDGHIVTVLHDGKVCETSSYEFTRMYCPHNHKGGKRAKKIARNTRTAKITRYMPCALEQFKPVEEDELPF